MAPRSFAALSVLVVALLAAPVAGLGSGVPGATAGGAAAGAVQEATTTGTGSPATATPTTVDRSTLPPSVVTWRVQLRPNGNARWTVSATVPIRDANDAAAFDDLAASFDDVENPLALDFFRAAATEASAATGREMGITDVSRSAGRENGTGTLAVSFRWSNFARVRGDRLSVGDGFNTTGGTWLPALTERQTLVIVPPTGYGVTSAPSVGITDGAARWEGPYNFSGREPWVVYSGAAPTTMPTTTPASPGSTASPGTGSPGTATPDGPLGSLLPVVGLAALAGVAAAALVVYMRREDGGIGPIGGADDDGTAGTSAAAAAGSGAEDAASSGAGGAPAAGASADADGGDDTDDTGDEVDEELLSDEERVERLLERNGGRMKQATIVTETGWSNAKVSQLLSSMAEEGRIDKLRIGRENLISFPDEDVTDVDSSSE
ncbi:MAG: hypothetical protein V5A44_09530 [Haloarculaceae archaeon]